MSAIPKEAAQTGALEALAAIVHSVRFDDLPVQVITAAKARVLDTLGCAYGAFDSDVADAVRRMAADCGGAAQATIIGTRGESSAPPAPPLNRTPPRYLDREP